MILPPIGIRITSGSLTNGNYAAAPPVTSPLLWQPPIRGLNQARDSRPFLLRRPGRGAAICPPRRPAGTATWSAPLQTDVFVPVPPGGMCLGKVWDLLSLGRSQIRLRVWPAGTCLGGGVCVVFRDSEPVICQKHATRQLTKEQKLKPYSSVRQMASYIALRLVSDILPHS